MNGQAKWAFKQQLSTYDLPVDFTKPPVNVSSLMTPEEADAAFYSVIRQYTNKELASVYNLDGVSNRIDLDTRYVYSYSTFDGLPELTKRLVASVKAQAKETWGVDVKPLFDPPLVFGYEERCVFHAHCDNSIFVKGEWTRNDAERDFTTVLYISGHAEHVTEPNTFSGGELIFGNVLVDEKPLTVKPTKGELLLFPSGPAFMHKVTPISRGYRIAVVNFWTIC